ncbi:MAG: DUF6134 family protein [Panacibacter sp.]
MLPLFIYQLIKKALARHWFKTKSQTVKITISRHMITATMLAVMMVVVCFKVFAQNLTLTYKVMQGNKEIGWLKLQRKDSCSSTFITCESEVKKRVLVMFSVQEKQDVLFRNGIMIRSHVYRKVNDDVKVNIYTLNQGTHYVINKTKSSEQLMISGIRDNQVSIYFKEPVNINQMYSDSYQRFLDIKNLGNHSYTINFPGGDTNNYYYTNGICTKVKLNHSLFSAEFVLTK